ncbi:MAG: hypothetical protein R6V40_00465, partial [Candidatus Moraniibacteriota bacterium]
MKKKIKKGFQKTINVKYRITIFTIFLLLVYGIGLWHFKVIGDKVSIIEGLNVANQNKIELEQNIEEMVAG